MFALSLSGREIKTAQDKVRNESRIILTEVANVPRIIEVFDNQEQGRYNPEVIRKYHYNVTEAQLELHRKKMEWCIGSIAKARRKHIDVEPELDLSTNLIG